MPLTTIGVATPQQFGAVGDGVTDDTAAFQACADFCFGPSTSPHGPSNANLNSIFFIPAANYLITAPIEFTAVAGGWILGAGRASTIITNTGAGFAGVYVFWFNGIARSRIEGFTLVSNNTHASILNLDWDGITAQSTQSNTIVDMGFDGGAIGCEIGRSGHQASENIFIDCYPSGCAAAGYQVSNYNALNNVVQGGTVGACAIGLYLKEGSISAYGVALEANTSWDIQIDNSAEDTAVFSACRSESVNFISVAGGKTVHLSGISHQGASAGAFIKGSNSGYVKADACNTINGNITGQGIEIACDSCVFGLAFSSVFAPAAHTVHWNNCTFNASATPVLVYNRTDYFNATYNNFSTTWPSDIALIPVKSGSGVATMAIPAGSRIKQVTLKQDTPGTGTINVGDSTSATRYMNAQTVSGAAPISSSLAWNNYPTTDKLTVASTGVSGFSGVVVVETVKAT